MKEARTIQTARKTVDNYEMRKNPDLMESKCRAGEKEKLQIEASPVK